MPLLGGELELLVFTDWAADVCITIISIATDIGTAISLRIALYPLMGAGKSGRGGRVRNAGVYNKLAGAGSTLTTPRYTRKRLEYWAIGPVCCAHLTQTQHAAPTADKLFWLQA